MAHGDLARSLVDTVAAVSGSSDALHPISNVTCGPEELEDRIREAVGGEAAIVFVDLATGSCARAARSVARELHRVAVVTGVNLPMLLDFVFNRDQEISDLSERVVLKSRAGTVAYPPEASA